MIGSWSRELSRRDFLSGVSSLGAASLLGLPGRAAAEPPPETTKLRIWGGGGVVTCVVPVYAAQDLLLRAEGFTDVQYVEPGGNTSSWPPDSLLSGEADISLSFPPTDILRIEAGAPVVILAGSHIGCVEVVGGNRVRSTPELKGKTAAVSQLGSDEHIFMSMFAAYVGLDPHKDINWVVHPWPEHLPLFRAGKIDALFNGPPLSQELRGKGIGHVLVNTTTDKPWSQYFCCLVATTKEFVRKNPVATKRALRAILKAGDVCKFEPDRVARLMESKGLARYEVTMQTLREIPYGTWREYNPEDALRFYALRMRDVGMLKSTPQQIISQGTDWRFLKELKKELKA
jgi:NitT/TauT family transport system substrate-binding protein